jgi:glycosyltransferase involved in cell wall biosynthesis
MTELISIIVPIYNTEIYLRKCIESVLNQSYENIELILINDGSTDGSGRICDQYALKDGRVIVLHGENVGIAAARNKGMDCASGEYLCFLDSDDYIAPQMLERLLLLLKTYNADLAMSDYQSVINDAPPEDKAENTAVELVSNTQALNKLFEKRAQQAAVVWNKLYARSLFDEIRFPEGKYFEDTYVTYRLYHKARKIVFTSEKLYFQVKRTTSVTGCPFNINRLDFLDGSKIRAGYFKKNKMFDLFNKSAYNHITSIITCYRRFENNSDMEKSVFKDLKTRFSRDLKHFDVLKTVPYRKRLYFILFGLSPGLHRFALTVWVAVKTKKYLRFKTIIKEKIKYKVLSGISFIAKILHGLRLIKHERIWLIGGASGRAYTDNSAAFHAYLVNSHPEINVFWVANKNCRDIDKISSVGPILYKRTIKLLYYLVLAEVLIVSHSKSDIYPYHAKMFKNVLKVYLGHGVNGFKKITRKGKFKTLNQDFDLFLANSAYEKSLIKTWNVDAEKIVVTGSPRNDQLFRIQTINKRSNEKVILYTPTWREWIDNDQNEFERFKTEFAKMVQDSNLNELLTQHGYKIYLFLHIDLHKHYETLINDYDAQGFIMLPLNIELQEYIVLSDLLITDYSSVAWDFILLNKPVIFYQFDLDLFEIYRGSYINMRSDLFGPSAYDLQGLTEIIRDHIDHNSIIRDYGEKMNEWKDKMFIYYDQNNCKRVAQEIFNCLEQSR